MCCFVFSNEQQQNEITGNLFFINENIILDEETGNNNFYKVLKN